MDTYIVTGANGDIAISIAEMLREKFPHARLIGTDIASQWPALAIFDEVEIISPAKSTKYLEDLNGLVNKYGPRFIIPTSEPEMRWIARNKGDFTHLPLMMNDPDLILTCMDKLNSVLWLDEKGIIAPRTTLLKDCQPYDLPVMVKPRFGAGSRGLEKVDTEERLVQIKQERDEDNVAQEFLEGENDEYTCALVTLSTGPRSFIMKRKLNYGVTTEMMGVKIPVIDELLTDIAQHLPLHAAINVQLRLVDGKKPMIFEINPRFSSTVKMRHMLGFSDFPWLVDDMSGVKPQESNPVYDRKIFRIYREVMEGESHAPKFQ